MKQAEVFFDKWQVGEEKMKIDAFIREKLSKTDGEMVDFKIPRSRDGKDRRSEMLLLLKEYNVENIIHVGCCGHLNNLDSQLKSGRWFHGMLCDNFKNVIGTDINKQAVNYLLEKQMGGITRIYDKDAVQESDELKKELYTCFSENKETAIILPEVLEHIEDPVSFLKMIKKSYEGMYIMISVPNCFGTWVLSDVVRSNVEKINSDHKYWFSPYTLLKVASLAEIEVRSLHFCDYSIFTKIVKGNILANTLLLVGKL